MCKNCAYRIGLCQEMKKLNKSHHMKISIELFIIANFVINESAGNLDILFLTMLAQRSDIFTYLLKTVKLSSEKSFTINLPLDLKAKAIYK